MGIERNRIVKRYLILCEGADTQNFLIQYLNSDALRYNEKFGNEIQAFDFGGINQLKKYIGNLINMENFEDINRLLIIRDSETDVQQAVDMIQAALKSAKLPVPQNCHEWKTGDDELKTAFTLMPACDSSPTPGTLEDLCWELLKGDSAGEMRRDVQDFVSRMKEKYNSIKAHEHKSRLHSYFSVNEKYISLKIGEAANSGAFDWNSPKLDSLKKLLEEGFE